MSQFRFAAWLLVLVSPLLTASPVEAVFHLWFIKEVYSNHDGTVQFIELFTSSNSQNQTSGQQITTGSGHMFTFPGNIGTASTANHHLLLATAPFDAVPNSPPPNFTTAPLSANFFSPLGDTITFVGADSKTFTSIPIDGVTSRNWPSFGSGGSTLATNSPTNFAGTPGSVNLPPPPPPTTGDYNKDGKVDAADYTVWRKTLDLPASPNGSGADGDSDGTIDQDDYDFWVERFGNTVPVSGGGAAIPEPATAVLLLVGLITVAGVTAIRRVSRR